jgi:hypothetical protein
MASNRLLKNGLATLRQAQGERKDVVIGGRGSVHAEPVEAWAGFFSNLLKDHRTDLRRFEKSLFAIAVLLLAALPWSIEYWPSTDGPNHLANVYILENYHHTDKPFVNYLEIEEGVRRIRPSNLHYLLLSLLAKGVDLATAQKVLVSLIFVALPLAVLFLLSRIAPNRIRSIFLVLPLIGGAPVGLGLNRFLLSVVFGLFFLAVAWTTISMAAAPTRRASTRLRTVGAAILLWIAVWFHPFVGIIPGLALLLLLGDRLRAMKTWCHLITIAAPAIMFLLATFLTGHSTPNAAANDWQTLPKLLSSILFAQLSFSPLEAYPKLVALVFLYLLAARFFMLHGLTGRDSESGCARLVFGLHLLFFLLPLTLYDWCGCNLRVLIFATYCLPLVADLPARIAAQRWLAPTMTLVVAVSVAVQWPVLQRYSAVYASAAAAAELVPRGSKVLPQTFIPSGSSLRNLPHPFTHLASNLVFLRDTINPHLSAAGKKWVGGERFRIIRYRDGVLSPDGMLPYVREESPWCKNQDTDECDKVIKRAVMELSAVRSQYDVYLFIDPPTYILAAVEPFLDLVGQVGRVWVFKPRLDPSSRRSRR